MRSIPVVLILLLLVLAQHPTRAAPSEDPLVVGMGNRLSGRVPVLYVGTEGDAAATALKRVLRAVEARSNLRLPLRIVKSLGSDAPPGALVVLGKPPDGGIDIGFAMRIAAKHGAAIILRSTPGSDVLPSWPKTGTLHDARDLPPLELTGLRAFFLPEGGACRVFAVPAETPSPSLVLLALRAAILGSKSVRHLPSAFGRISGETKGDTLALSVETLLPGEVELSLLTVEGETILDPGPVRGIALDEIADLEGTLVRLVFRGESGLTDELRLWLRELVPGAIPSIRIEGMARLPVGEPLLLRMGVLGLDGLPIPGCRAEATLIDRHVLATTDAAGAALLSFGPFSASEIGAHDLVVGVAGPRFQRSLCSVVEVVPRPRSLLVVTDRPVYRPGGIVTFRATVTDALTRAGLEETEVTVEVEDTWERKIATVTATTGEFGTAVLEVPLSEDLPEGEYRLRAATEGATAQASFRVEQIFLPRFSIEVSLAKEVFTASEPVLGTVRASTLTGEPLSGATARVELLTDEPPPPTDLGLDESGVGEFELAPLRVRAADARLLVTVTHADARVSKTVPVRFVFEQKLRIVLKTDPAPLLAGIPGKLSVTVLHADGVPLPADLEVRFGPGPGVEREAPPGGSEYEVPGPLKAGSVTVQVLASVADGRRATLTKMLAVESGVAIQAPATAQPGEEFPVVVRATPRSGHVVLDLVARGRLLAGCSAVIEEGRGLAIIDVPKSAVGPTTLVARLVSDDPRMRAAEQPVDVVTSPLRLSVRVDPREARPRDVVRLLARVTDLDGAGRPALLDLRGYDRAYLELTGERLPEAGDRPSVRSHASAPLLAQIDSHRARALLAVRADRAARPALLEAVKALGAGREIQVSLPWGAPLIFSAVGRQTAVSGEPAVTGFETGAVGTLWPGPAAIAHASSADNLLSVLSLLPRWAVRSAPVERSQRQTADAGLSGFPGLQEQDGSFRVLGSRAPLSLFPGETPGDPWLEPGMTGLVLLSYLGAGYTHKHSGYRPNGFDESPRYRSTVGNGLKFLRSIQGGDGFLGDHDAPWALLNHAMGTLALAEAYALTGAPLVRGASQEALDVLAQKQRSDGSFSEAGWEHGSLVLTAWATIALKSGKNAGLRIDPAVFEGISRWVDAHAAPGAGAVAPSDEEVALYPFVATARAPQPAALTAAIRIFLGEDPRRSETLHRLVTVLRANLPIWDEHLPPDLHGFYWGTLVCFQVGGDTWKAWNTALKDSVIHHQIRKGPGRGTWPSFGRIGRVVSTAFGVMCMEIYYRYARVFGTHGGPGFVRSDFPDLMVSDLAWPTDAAGVASRDLTLPDSVTVWDLRVGAWDGRGGYARAETELVASLPLRLEVDLPPQLYEEDRIRVPVRVVSTLDRAVEAEVSVALAEGLAASPRRRTVVVPARGTALAHIDVVAKGTGPACLRLSMRGAEHTDAVERRTEILGKGVPFNMSFFAETLVPLRIARGLPEDARGLRARLLVSGGPLGDAGAGLEGLIRRPTGCFEQITATMYPALLALAYLERTGQAAPDLVKRARQHLLAGYQGILGCEVDGGGFSLYGKGKARPVLTALGIHLLLDLAEFQEVDREVIDRAVAMLEQGLPARTADRVYALAALRRAGREAEQGRVLLAGSSDPYTVALAVVHGQAPPEEAQRARSLLSGSANRRGARVFWTPHGPTLFTGGTHGSEVETTALAALALHLLSGPRDLIAGALLTLRARREGDGGWETTRETVAALRTLIAVGSEAPASGTLVVKTRPGDAWKVAVSPTGETRIDLGPIARDEVLSFEFAGRGTPFVTIDVEGVSSAPPPEDGPIGLAVRWPEDPMEPGAGCAVEIEVWRRSGRRVHAPLVVIPLPAGFRPDREGMREATADAGFGRVEVKRGRIYLYLENLARRHRVRIPLVPDTRGRLHTGAVRAWPYYQPDDVTILPGRTLEVGVR